MKKVSLLLLFLCPFVVFGQETDPNREAAEAVLRRCYRAHAAVGQKVWENAKPALSWEGELTVNFSKRDGSEHRKMNFKATCLQDMAKRRAYAYIWGNVINLSLFSQGTSAQLYSKTTWESAQSSSRIDAIFKRLENAKTDDEIMQGVVDEIEGGCLRRLNSLSNLAVHPEEKFEGHQCRVVGGDLGNNTRLVLYIDTQTHYLVGFKRLGEWDVTIDISYNEKGLPTTIRGTQASNIEHEKMSASFEIGLTWLDFNFLKAHGQSTIHYQNLVVKSEGALRLKERPHFGDNEFALQLDLTKFTKRTMHDFGLGLKDAMLNSFLGGQD